MNVELVVNSVNTVGENNIFIAGGIITGSINYVLTKAKTFNKVSVSLKGDGKLNIVDKWSRRRYQGPKQYYAAEIYENVENIIHCSENSKLYPAGSYTEDFSLTIPNDIPPSFKYIRKRGRYSVKCSITHKIKVLFKKNGLLGDTVKVKKVIYIISGVESKLPDVPLIYGSQKKMTQLFNFKQTVINLKAKIEKSVVKPGDEVNFSYEVSNDSNLRILTVRVKIMELHTFKAPGVEVNHYEKINDIVWKSDRISRRSKYSETFVASLLKTAFSVNFSKLVKKNYCIHITAVLPCPRQNLVLRIPVMVDAIVDRDLLYAEEGELIKCFSKKLIKS